MYTALRATSQTLARYLRDRFETDPNLAPSFNPASGGTMLVTLNTPQEMMDADIEGLSVWLYRLIRDEERLNAPPQRIGLNLLRPPPLPVRLETLSLEEIARVWDALDAPYQLSASYEVSVVEIASEIEPEQVSPVLVALPEYGVIVPPNPL